MGVYAAARELQLTVSIGCAPTKMLAKLASQAAKPNGLHVVHSAQVGFIYKDGQSWKFFPFWHVMGKSSEDTALACVWTSVTGRNILNIKW